MKFTAHYNEMVIWGFFYKPLLKNVLHVVHYAWLRRLCAKRRTFTILQIYIKTKMPCYSDYFIGDCSFGDNREITTTVLNAECMTCDM